ncbi:hypothetical protein [Kribbella sp. NPDC051770]|uniref:hypothetical protein n=1 Tax=Kribbella sp. NPDC051770 TaxID=3155413 RepID=UPI00341D8F0B
MGPLLSDPPGQFAGLDVASEADVDDRVRLGVDDHHASVFRTAKPFANRRPGWTCSGKPLAGVEQLDEDRRDGAVRGNMRRAEPLLRVACDRVGLERSFRQGGEANRAGIGWSSTRPSLRGSTDHRSVDSTESVQPAWTAVEGSALAASSVNDIGESPEGPLCPPP